MGGGLKVERRLEDEEGEGRRSHSYANYRKRIIGHVTAELNINAANILSDLIMHPCRLLILSLPLHHPGAWAINSWNWAPANSSIQSLVEKRARPLKRIPTGRYRKWWIGCQDNPHPPFFSHSSISSYPPPPPTRFLIFPSLQCVVLMILLLVLVPDAKLKALEWDRYHNPAARSIWML